MRVALISPYSIGTMRGNITTARRIDRFLNQVGIETLVLASDALSVEEMSQRLVQFSPTLIHGLHARYGGEVSLLLADRFRIPFVITITGSDLCDPVLRDHPETAKALEHAAAIACFSILEAEELAARFPGVSGRIAVVPQGVEILPDSAASEFGIPAGTFTLLLPAALRPVKNVEFAISAIKPLWFEDNRLRLVIAGGEIHRTYADGIRTLLEAAPWARWLGEVPYEQMGALYRRADVVLNCSRYEGMPNSLMEAMALGRPVVAADIPGNHSLIKHGETGWLYGNESDFRTLMPMLIHDEKVRTEVGGHARKCIEDNFSPLTEAERYRKLYYNLT